MNKITDDDLERRKGMFLSDLIKEDGDWMHQFVRPCVLNDDDFARLGPYIDKGLMKLGYSFTKNLSTARIRSKWLRMFGINTSFVRGDVPYQVVSLVDQLGAVTTCSMSQYLHKIWNDSQNGVCEEYIVKPVFDVKQRQ